MNKISIIIPVYNTEKYLKECLDSIINQTLKDIEIICIDDGSTDNSLNILNEYKNKDSRIKILIQENKGLASSRNACLKVAKGKYIYFMDSDDILVNDAIERLYCLSEKNELDIVIFKLINFNDGTYEEFTSDYYEMNFLKEMVKDNIFNYKDVGGKLFDIAVSAPGKFYKNDLISDIRFPENLIFEDNPFFIESMFKAKRVMFYDEYLYKRRIRDNSITTSQNLSLADTIPISNSVIDIAKEYNYYEQFKENILEKKINNTFIRFSNVKDIYKEDFFKLIQRDFILIKEDVKTSKLNHYCRYIFDNALLSNDYKEFEFNCSIYGNPIFKKLHSYEYIRVDMKNIGDANNSIIILENSDMFSKVQTPPWLNDDKGKGFLVESPEGQLNLKLKMVNDGELKIWFRGIDLRDESNNRIKILVDYTKLTINGDVYLDNHNLHWHDKPFVFKKDVKNSEIYDINIEWMTYDKMSSYVDEINSINKKFEKLTEEHNELIGKYNELAEAYSKSWKITNPFKKFKK